MTLGIELETNGRYCLASHSGYASEPREGDETSEAMAVVQNVVDIGKLLGGQFQMAGYLG